MRPTIFLLAALAVMLLTGCNEAQIERAEQAVAMADVRVSQADQAMAVAKQALASAEELSQKLDASIGAKVIADAKAAVATAESASAAAHVASDVAHKAVDAAKAAQAAGGSSVDVLLAVIGTAVPSLGALLAALRKLWDTASALRQTVAGVEAAKTKLAPDAIATLHGELASAQDEKAKQAVALVKAQAA
jgi:hypothetical protein